ncbi:MAG TPA: LysM peptidoglycan-binding domain-containing protein [Armatimonadota bacterium]|nr:LysM peptidoglycan-binding domain-containing protein [Armatimonadota bacterium]
MQTRKENRRKRHHNYRRIGLLSLVAIAALGLLISPLGLTSDSENTSVTSVSVAHGDTLWKLARTHGPDNADPRRTISRITRLNHLDDSIIRPGDVLLIPTS